MPKHPDRSWTVPWYAGTRTLTLSLDEQVVTVDTRIDGRELPAQRVSLEQLLRGESVADPATESAVLLAMARGKAHGLSGDTNERWRFWQAFDPAAVPAMEALSVAPGEPTYRVFATPEGLRRHPVGTPAQEYVARWDGVFLHGPVRGALPLDFRRELRRGLRSALASGARSLRTFPLLDYDELPTKTWSTGDATAGSKARFDHGWLRWEGWDNQGRPEGGTMLYSVERVFAGLHSHVPIPADELGSIERRATLRE
ncbi:MAG: hypothetical protein IPH72_14885 [Sandaracinaceae bacterium]|nr:hypothetical protein [Sandaracinaceae bacterium]